MDQTQWRFQLRGRKYHMNWEMFNAYFIFRKKYGFWLEVTSSIYLYVRLNDPASLIFFYLEVFRGTPTQIKKKRSVRREAQLFLWWIPHPAEKMSTSPFNIYAINEKHQHTYHLFFDVASVIVIFNTIYRIKTQNKTYTAYCTKFLEESKWIFFFKTFIF